MARFVDAVAPQTLRLNPLNQSQPLIFIIILYNVLSLSSLPSLSAVNCLQVLGVSFCPIRIHFTSFLTSFGNFEELKGIYFTAGEAYSL